MEVRLFCTFPNQFCNGKYGYHRDYYNDGDTIISDDPTRNTYKADDIFTIEI